MLSLGKFSSLWIAGHLGKWLGDVHTGQNAVKALVATFNLSLTGVEIFAI